jgi:hypothetical protein
MKSFWSSVLATVLAGAIGAIALLLFQFNERLARLETKMDLLVNSQPVTITKK